MLVLYLQTSKCESDGMKTYRNKFGSPKKSSRVIKSFSMTFENARYLEGVNKGEKSDVVNRALALYRSGSGRYEDLQDQITFWREAYHEVLNKNESPPPTSKGKKSISIGYILTYPFQLLHQRLTRTDRDFP